MTWDYWGVGGRTPPPPLLSLCWPTCFIKEQRGLSGTYRRLTYLIDDWHFSYETYFFAEVHWHADICFFATTCSDQVCWFLWNISVSGEASWFPMKNVSFRLWWCMFSPIGLWFVSDETHVLSNGSQMRHVSFQRGTYVSNIVWGSPMCFLWCMNVFDVALILTLFISLDNPLLRQGFLKIKC